MRKNSGEAECLNRIDEHSGGKFALIAWSAGELRGDRLLALQGGQNMIKVAFICTHNSCRSQIAEALGRHLAGDVFESFSAGTETKPQINRDAVRLMKQLYGIDMEKAQHPKLLSELPPIDVVVTMGCGVECPYLPCKHREDWGLDDPTGKSDEEFVRVIRQIENNVLSLKEKLITDGDSEA
jgi:arsenate reductase